MEIDAQDSVESRRNRMLREVRQHSLETYLCDSDPPASSLSVAAPALHAKAHLRGATALVTLPEIFRFLVSADFRNGAANPRTERRRQRADTPV